MSGRTQNTPKGSNAKKLATAYRAVYAVGVLSIFMGLLTAIALNKTPGGVIIAILFFALGLFYLLLGFLVQRKSMVALGIAVALMMLNALTGIYNMIRTGSPTGLIIPIVFFSQTWEGFKAIQEFKQRS